MVDKYFSNFYNDIRKCTSLRKEITMIHETLDITLDYAALGIKHDDSKATITSYIYDNEEATMGERLRPLVIVIPGGGYGHLSFREGEAVAIKLMSYGFNVCVLRYSLKPNSYPSQLYELASTIAFIRDNHKLWQCDPNKIIVAGFSAGAHLAASLGVMWNDDALGQALSIDKEKLKPDALMLGYPVITSGEFSHANSFINLLGENYNGLLEDMSLENRVTPDFPKTFMWHTFEDQSVPLENSLLFANALRRADIPFEYHVFPKGSHGLALCTKETNPLANDKYEPQNAVWMDLFVSWLEHNIF